MPQGIIVDGQRVLASGVYVENKYSEQPGAPSGQGTVAIVGDFNFLQKNTPYVSTSKLALENLIAPGEPTIMRIARVAYKSTRGQVLSGGAPAGVVLISPATTTQAEIELPIVAGTAPKAISKIWGPRGNSTRFLMQHRGAVTGIKCTISNRGFTEVIECPAEASAFVISYTARPPVPAPAGTVTDFADDGGGEGLLELSKTGDGIVVSFKRTVPAAAMLSSSHASWMPRGPVVGTVSVTAKAGMTLAGGATTDLMARAIGLDADGLPVDETITLTPDGDDGDFGADATVPFQADFSSLTEVRLYASTGLVTDGTAVISGTCFDLQETAQSNVVTVADAIAYVNGVGAGFYAYTRSGRVTSIPVAEMDELTAVAFVDTATTVSTSAGVDAQLWALNTAIEDQSQLVELDITDWDKPVAAWVSTTAYVAGDVVDNDGTWYLAIDASTDKEPGVDVAWETYWEEHTGFDLVLSGGTYQTATTAEWEATFNELLFTDCHAVVPFSTDDTIIGYLDAHITKSFGKYQNERTGFYGVTGLSPYTTLVQKASAYNTQRVQRAFERCKMVQYTGRTETLETYWTALAMACAANGNRRRSLDRWQPDFVDVVRHDSLASPEYNDALIALGFSTFYKWPNQPVKLLLENTAWTADNNEYKVAAAAVRSTVDLQRDIRALAETIIESATSIDASGPALEASIPRRLNELVQYGIILRWNSSTFVIRDLPGVFEIEFEYQPNGSKSYVKIIATVARPAAS